MNDRSYAGNNYQAHINFRFHNTNDETFLKPTIVTLNDILSVCILNGTVYV